MEIPLGIIEAVVAATVAFVFKVVFGLIDKNERKSDDSDRRIVEDLKETHQALKELERKFISNDRELYEKVGQLQQEVRYYTGIYEGHKESRE